MRGSWDLDRCPLGILGEEAWLVLEAADLAARGLWPVAGGMLDQAASGLEAIQFVWREERAARRRLGLKESDL